MKATLRAGLSHHKRYLVTQSKVVAELYPESIPMQAMPRVLATGYLVGLVEWACIEALNPHLDWPLEQTVGTKVDITHEAPTSPGLEVTVTVTLVQVDGRRLVFEIEASDGVDTITRRRHERTIIDRERFAAKTERKRQQHAYTRTAAQASNGAALADRVGVLAVDIFGTTVDWWSGIAGHIEKIAGQQGITVDAGDLASRWRDQYLPSMARVNNRQRDWVYLDTLHHESLDELLAAVGLADALDQPARDQLVRGWHRLPAWPDAADALARLRSRYTVVAFSNGGFVIGGPGGRLSCRPVGCPVLSDRYRRWQLIWHVNRPLTPARADAARRAALRLYTVA